MDLLLKYKPSKHLKFDVVDKPCECKNIQTN